MPVTDPDQIAYQTANIHQDRGGNIIAACSVLSALSTLAVFLRIVVRRITHAGLRADDYLMFAALVGVNQALFGLDLEREIGPGVGPVCCHLLRYRLSLIPLSREHC